MFDDGTLFSAADAVRSVRALPMLPACDRCGLYRRCRSPKMGVSGQGRRRVLIIGDYPGEKEDDKGEAFVGGAGWILEKALREIGVDMRRDCWLGNARACYSPDAKDHETADEDCRPKVFAEIRKLDPEVILLAGTHAVHSVIGHLWKEKCGPVSRWAGWRIPVHEPNVWVCSTYNPAVLAYKDSDPVLSVEFLRHLKECFELRGRPWKNGPPNYRSRVEVVADPDEAARRIRTFSGLVAYDYETNCLKPDAKTSEIVCCGLSDGKRTIAFPWVGAVKDAMADLLEDGSVGKIASNLDMEDRWTREFLGIEVDGWRWDTMLGAHALDPRGDTDRKSENGITGLKFQAFVRTGQPVYNEQIEPYLSASEKGGYAINRIRRVGFNKLGIYCGMDALLEWEVARDQMSELGIESE